MILFLIGMFCFSQSEEAYAGYEEALKNLRLPAGYQISLVAPVPGARSIARGDDGTLYVGSGAFSNPHKRVYRLKDWNKSGKIESDEVEILIDGLNNPNGVAFRKGSLYVAEITRVLVFKDIAKTAKGKTLAAKDGTALPQTFPSETHHGWKFIRFAPAPNDNWLYVPVGAPCNVCESEPIYSAIHKINVDGKEIETVASGVRNTVGFDFHPDTKNLWFTDNGRDMLGDNMPGDELNELTSTGQNFGFPYCHASNINDPEFNKDGKKLDCTKTKTPVSVLGPHVAALGMRFWNKQIYIAEHGSWNSSKKQGYKVSTVRFDGKKYIYEDFVTGWLNEKTQTVWGRPVDVEALPDGSLLISDDGLKNSDFSGAIYKVQIK